MNKKVLPPILFIFTALLNGCLSAEEAKPCDVAMGSHTAVTPVPRPDVTWWMPRHQAVLERGAQGNAGLLMIGDSITHGWENSGKSVRDKYYASRNAVNIGFSGDRKATAQWAKNAKASELASKMADGKMIFFLDINKAFLNEQGELTREVMPDLLHPNEKGYLLWAEAMEPTVAKLLRETK